MNVCICACKYVRMYTCMYVCMRVCVRIYACMHACGYVWVCIYVCMHVYKVHRFSRPMLYHVAIFWFIWRHAEASETNRPCRKLPSSGNYKREWKADG